MAFAQIASHNSFSPIARHIASLFLALLAGVSPAIADDEGWIEFADGESRPSLAVTIGDTQGVALLHTLMPTNAVSASFAERAGIASGKRSFPVPGGQGTATDAEPFELEFAGSPMQASDFIIVPDDLARADVVFGRPLFQGALIQLDYPNRRLRILPGEGADIEGNVRFRASRYGRPMVETRIDGKRLWMAIDTSSDGLCTLKHQVVKRRKWHERAIAAERLGGLDVALDDALEPMMLEGFEMGPYKFGGFLAAYSPDGGHAIDARELTNDVRRQVEHFEADGLLGYEVLRNFIVTLNVAEDVAHFYAP